MDSKKLSNLRLLNLVIEQIKSQPNLRASTKKLLSKIEFCLSEIIIIGYENCGHFDVPSKDFLGSYQDQLRT